ncbi:MAG: hypothetical protein H7641_01195 [Candidatus Heimdallarchaeota archaeon]|nr:hypothetical protein [Candidatus Heimdallarchaeota archaeon]MCK4876183.1 hypothetical protein [Candidatus Heimdallarchaeota archaeon]
MKVYHVSKKDLLPLKEPYKFLNGDVYVVETDTEMWIWLGSKCYVDDKTVGAWMARILEQKNQDLKIRTILESEEPTKFTEIIDFEVVEGDTPGFLKHFEKQIQKDLRLLQLREDDKGDVDIIDLPIGYQYFKSDDAFLLDAQMDIYIWIGKDSQIKEKYEAGRISRKLEVERKFAPLVYVIEEENEPEGFRDMIFKLGIKDGVIELRTTVTKKDKSQDKKWWQVWK